jgi:hypothetical protein
MHDSSSGVTRLGMKVPWRVISSMPTWLELPECLRLRLIWRAIGANHATKNRDGAPAITASSKGRMAKGVQSSCETFERESTRLVASEAPSDTSTRDARFVLVLTGSNVNCTTCVEALIN